MNLLTPPGHGGIAVVVATAAGERAALRECLHLPRGGHLPIAAGGPPRRALLRWDDVVRDDVLVVDRGEFGLEIHVHGGPAIIAALAQRFGPLQPLPASAAELLLRSALSTAQMQLAIEQMACDFGAFLSRIEAMPADERSAAIAAAQQRTLVAMALATPLRLVLVGRQNAGKSTLFNRLLLQERALTGAQPGLTRDPVAEVTCLDDYPYELVDTAGEGAAATAVDTAAIERARRFDDGVRMLVVDGSVGPTAADRALLRPGTIVLASKADLPSAQWPAAVPCDLRVAGADPTGAADLRLAVGTLLRRCRGLPVAGPVGGPAALTTADEGALQRLASAAGLPRA